MRQKTSMKNKSHPIARSPKRRNDKAGKLPQDSRDTLQENGEGVSTHKILGMPYGIEESSNPITPRRISPRSGRKKVLKNSNPAKEPDPEQETSVPGDTVDLDQFLKGMEAEGLIEIEPIEQTTQPLEASSPQSPEEIFIHLLTLRRELIELYNAYCLSGEQGQSLSPFAWLARLNWMSVGDKGPKKRGTKKTASARAGRGSLKTQTDRNWQEKPTKRNIPWLEARFAGLHEQLNSSTELEKAATKVHQAWSLLDSEKRQQVLELLHGAYGEATRMILHADLNANNQKKQNDPRKRSMEKRRRKVQTAARNFCAAVKTSGEKFLDALDAYLVDTPRGKFFSREVEKYLEEAQEIIQAFQHIEQEFYSESKSQEAEPSEPATPLKQGPKELERRNKAILEIEDIFRSLCRSKRQPRIHTHTLLYVAGLWTDPEPDSLQLKAANLRKSRSTNSARASTK
jgi:hypothetical protein